MESKILSLHLRERFGGPEGRVQRVEVLDDDEILGQLPTTKVVVESTPRDLCMLTITLIVKRADVESRP